MAEDICFVCEESFGELETSTVKQRAIATLITTSKRRKDRKYSKYDLTHKESLVVHNKCYKSYTREGSIIAYLRKSQKPVARTSMRSSVKFDFEKNCLFCGCDASESFVKNESRKSHGSKHPVRLLTEETREKILNTAAIRSDSWGNEVLDRVALVDDLVMAKARYHVACHPRFFDQRSKPKTITDDTPHIIDIIEQFIQDHPDEHQFSLKKMVDNAEYARKDNLWIKKKLYERLGDDIIITSSPGSEPIISLREKEARFM